MLRTKILFWVQALLFMSGYTHQTMGPLKNGSRRSFKKRNRKERRQRQKRRLQNAYYLSFCSTQLLDVTHKRPSSTVVRSVHGRPVRSRRSLLERKGLQGHVHKAPRRLEGLRVPEEDSKKERVYKILWGTYVVFLEHVSTESFNSLSKTPRAEKKGAKGKGMSRFRLEPLNG